MARKVTKELLESILPDWEVSQLSETSFDITRHSPAGEHVIMPLQGENLWDMATFAENYYDDFDADDHAAVIYHLKHYGTPDEQKFYASAPGDIDDLLRDARTIDNWYYEVYSKLREAWDEEDDDGDDTES